MGDGEKGEGRGISPRSSAPRSPFVQTAPLTHTLVAATLHIVRRYVSLYRLVESVREGRRRQTCPVFATWIPRRHQNGRFIGPATFLPGLFFW